MAKNSIGSKGKATMNVAAAARIQSATAKGNGGRVAPGGFAPRAQSAAATNSNINIGKADK